ncbi:MAG TPA: NADH-quinone oxidoreductase subunit NuoH [Verrucomicrobiales bacterium]|nr:NADH-quinone oxidoreductase subunit NuoH [Verrucomicrobiales bacterium]HIL71043.1 NADH-quinone oxidoreductase subunit NuoH [Verrucomicrobiota bacterium]
MDWVYYLTPSQEFLVFSIVKVALVVGLLLPMIAYSVMAERRISAWIQGRVGPNRVGPFGLLQPIADGIKSLLKEDFVPDHVRKCYFWLAPALTLIPSFLVLAVVPFGSYLGPEREAWSKMVIADLNIGILFTFGIVSLSVYGIVLAGYASNSKYSFLGGIRATAQMISYEISMGLAVIPLFMLTGVLNLGEVIAYQVEHGWLIWKQPISFILFLVAAFAETNRLPFDLPESETELVSGYHTEYSSMKFALFFLGEYAAMIAVSAMMVTLFFGGWTLPIFGLDQPAITFFGGLLHIMIFLGKVLVFMVLFIWIRWMLPRFRYDQLMDLGWTRFLPLAFVNIIVTAAWLWAQYR